MADATGGAKGFQDGTDQMCSIRSYHCGKHGLPLDMGKFLRFKSACSFAQIQFHFNFGP